MLVKFIAERQADPCYKMPVGPITDKYDGNTCEANGNSDALKDRISDASGVKHPRAGSTDFCQQTHECHLW